MYSKPFVDSAEAIHRDTKEFMNTSRNFDGRTAPREQRNPWNYPEANNINNIWNNNPTEVHASTSTGMTGQNMQGFVPQNLQIPSCSQASTSTGMAGQNMQGFGPANSRFPYWSQASTSTGITPQNIQGFATPYVPIQSHAQASTSTGVTGQQASPSVGIIGQHLGFNTNQSLPSPFVNWSPHPLREARRGSSRQNGFVGVNNKVPKHNKHAAAKLLNFNGATSNNEPNINVPPGFGFVGHSNTDNNFGLPDMSEMSEISKFLVHRNAPEYQMLLNRGFLQGSIDFVLKATHFNFGHTLLIFSQSRVNSRIPDRRQSNVNEAGSFPEVSQFNKYDADVANAIARSKAKDAKEKADSEVLINSRLTGTSHWITHKNDSTQKKANRDMCAKIEEAINMGYIHKEIIRRDMSEDTHTTLKLLTDTLEKLHNCQADSLFGNNSQTVLGCLKVIAECKQKLEAEYQRLKINEVSNGQNLPGSSTAMQRFQDPTSNSNASAALSLNNKVLTALNSNLGMQQFLPNLEVPQSQLGFTVNFNAPVFQPGQPWKGSSPVLYLGADCNSNEHEWCCSPTNAGYTNQITEIESQDESVDVDVCDIQTEVPSDE